MGAPFGWLMKALDVGRRNPQALFGGFLLLLLVGLVPSLLQMAGDAWTTQLSAEWISIYALSMVTSIVLLSPLAGGAMRLVQRCEAGLPTRATDIFEGYRDRAFALRMIGLGFAFLAIGLAVMMVLYVVLPDRDAVLEMFKRAAATPTGGQPDLSGLDLSPGGLLLWLLGTTVMLIVMVNAQMLAFARAALEDRGVAEAIVDGFTAAFRNLLPFIGFAIAMSFIGLVVLLIASIIIGLVIFVLAAISKTLAMVVTIPLYLALMLALYVVTFAFYCHAWRDIFAVPAGPGAPVDAGTLAA